MLRRAFFFLLALPLAACVGEPYATGGSTTIPAPLGAAGAASPSKRQVAALLPLTGKDATLGQAMLRAVRLALATPDSPPLDAEDTGSTPVGATAAARTALDKGAGLIVGPLTAPETAAVAPLALAAGVPVLALTSDATQAKPGIWTLGITPGQQVHALVHAVVAEGKTRFAAVLPENAFGNALADGFQAATSEAGLPPASLRRYTPRSASALTQALKEVSNYASRRDALEARQRASQPPAAPGTPAAPDGGADTGTPPAQPPTAETAPGTPSSASPGAPPGALADADAPALPLPPLPFDALLLGTVGSDLAPAANQLAPLGLSPGDVRVLGPAPWQRDATHVQALVGAWFAAPDPEARKPFETAYTAKYGSAPPTLASIAYDAGGLAKASAGPGGFDVSSLQRPEGFAGSDGLLALLPDGRVRRAFAIFEVQPGAAHVVQPAPQSFAAPGT